MNEVVRFALLGLGVGALYALASQGLIVIYRGTGVLNFSLGATAIAGVFAQWELQTEYGWPFLASAVAGVAWAAFLGVLTHWLIMKPLRRASSLVRVIATLGVLITVQAATIIRYGSQPRQVDSWLPTDRVNLWSDVSFTVDRLILLLIACASAAGLWLLYRSSQFGLATEAVSESERAAAAIGLNPNWIAVGNWALGSAIATVAGILVVPIITLQITAMTGLVLAALAAALVADFRSFLVATVAGFALGIGQALVGRFVDQQGLRESLPFLVIIVFLVFRGRALPLRDFYLRRQPMLGNGRMSWDWTLFATGVIVFLLLTKDTKWIDAITVSLGVAIVLLSVVLLTGYAGQLSLAQYAFAGWGAYVAGRLVAVYDIPFLLGLVLGVAAAVPVGLVFGLPAVRTRGINLAIVTLGLGTTMELMLFRNRDLTGGVQGTQVGDPDLFGFDIGSIRYPARYAIFVLVIALLTVWVVSNVRRSRSGRRLIAVRTNERAAAALGIDVTVAKLYAFALSAAIAALGGIVLAFRLSSISYQSYDNFTSITYVGLTLVGGVGHLLGAFVGATMATAGLNQEILESNWEGVGRWIGLISGVSILLMVLAYQDGVAAEWVKMFRFVKKLRKWGQSYAIDLSDVAAADTEDPDSPRRVPARGAGHREPDRPLRGRGRGRRRVLPVGARHDHRPDRSERGGQDLTDRRRQRIRRLRRHGRAPRSRNLRGPRPHHRVAGGPGPGRGGTLVPVARALRGLDGVREPQRCRRPSGPSFLSPRPGVAGESSVPTRGGAGHQGVPARPGPPPRRARPVVREATVAGHRSSGGHAPQRPPSRRAGRRPQRHRERRTGGRGPTAGQGLGYGGAGGGARHDVRDGRVRPGGGARLRRDDRLGQSERGPNRPGRDRRLPGR